MKAAWYDAQGPAREVLRVGELDRPAPAPGEVLVRMHATAVNPSDTKARSGRGPRPKLFPRIIPHQDGAGVIEAVGAGIDPSRIGERVWLYEAQFGRAFGCAAQYVALPAKKAVPLAAGTSFEEGACLGIPALTAHRCVFADGPVEGKTVLVTGGAGAVGFYAIQFAAQAGAQVIATVSREEQAEAARAAGAHFIIDRKHEDVAARIAELTGAADGRGIDRVVEVAFGANLPTTLKVLKIGGAVATYASDAVQTPELPVLPLIGLNATLHFVLLYLMDEPAHQAAIAATNAALAAGRLQHQIGARFDLDHIADAHEALEGGQVVGKVVVSVE